MEFPVQASASAFANWVFLQSKGRVYHKTFAAISEREQLLGHLDHQEIDRLQKSKWMSDNFGDAIRDYYVFYFDDGTQKRTFSASSLLVNGEPLACRPDLVFRHKTEPRVIIVERKTTRQFRPLDHRLDQWDNVKAQLWCYSFIDEWAHGHDVSLVAEFWLHRGEGAGLVRGLDPFIWTAEDPELQDLCSTYFRRYGGTIQTNARCQS